jgi:iron(III) transport system ATP-binding protein
MLKLINVSKEFSAIKAVHDVSITVEKGERLVIIGPSGSGKTTILRMIAGFESPDRGNIFINDIEVSNGRKIIPPHKRNIGMVFQDLALWPHMTARQHILFCLNKDGRDKETAEGILDLTGLKNHLNKYPFQLSGGERQRLGIARAIAQSPRILLLDEPMTSLDPLLKEELLALLLNIHDKLKSTMIYVTHDQREACFFSDKGVIMKDGEIEQSGTWEEMILKPANHFVEAFTKGMAGEIKK